MNWGNPVWTHMAPYDAKMSCISSRIPYRFFFFILSRTVPCYLIWSSFYLYSCIVPYCPIWSCLVLYGALWSCMDSSGPVCRVWSRLQLFCSSVTVLLGGNLKYGAKLLSWIIIKNQSGPQRCKKYFPFCHLGIIVQYFLLLSRNFKWGLCVYFLRNLISYVLFDIYYSKNMKIVLIFYIFVGL